jgi:hypothetical protein
MTIHPMQPRNRATAQPRNPQEKLVVNSRETVGMNVASPRSRDPSTDGYR